ncbi:PseD protein [Campylobacter sp. MIT 12-8780]|uniref:motility associated factor glycosyltransferase family protein n=1 Tax=Campylobacter sp. MIT 12-8780 TaxID=2202200 RepID=UPI00115D2681|nr:PseD protein [Campylobacter sp. MIT 12-8780]
MGGGAYLYHNALNELHEKLKLYNDTYLLYPVLYFYGFGNGLLYKVLLQNAKREKIIIFESKIKLLYSIFHAIDFSAELSSQRLIILDPKELDMSFLISFCASKPYFNFARIYFLEPISDYYESFKQELLELNQKLLYAFKQAILRRGNDSTDALEGIEHFVYNLDKMLTHTDFKSFVSHFKNTSKNAIIVSTGPSLIKQLDLLKKSLNKALIFCADSAYPILAQAGIKPNFVCCFERSALTAEFFNNDFKEFDEGIIFILASLVHPNAIKYLERNKRSYILIPRYSHFSLYYNFKDYFYISLASNVADMGINIALNLYCEHIILIGQDLAFDEKGNSHPKEYQNKADFESAMFEESEVLAYGGDKLVKTHEMWLMFKAVLEQLLSQIPPFFKVYNATEGGVRIENCIEKPFKECYDELFTQELAPLAKLKPPKPNKSDENMLKAYAKTKKSISHCEQNKALFSLKLKSLMQGLKHLNNENDLAKAQELIKDIDALKHIIDAWSQEKDLLEICTPLLTQFELKLAQIYTQNSKTKQEAFEKSLQWIQEHCEFFNLLIHHLNAQEQALKRNIKPLENTLLQRGFKKYLRI